MGKEGLQKPFPVSSEDQKHIRRDSSSVTGKTAPPKEFHYELRRDSELDDIKWPE
jgi:hypothetical protein